MPSDGPTIEEFDFRKMPALPMSGGWRVVGFRRQVGAGAHLLDVLLVVGRRRHGLRGARDRRDQLHRRHRLAGRLRRHVLEALAPGRQRRDHGIALHVVARALPDLGLHGAHVVHHVADHDTEPVFVKSSELHLGLLPLQSNSQPAFTAGAKRPRSAQDPITSVRGCESRAPGRSGRSARGRRRTRRCSTPARRPAPGRARNARPRAAPAAGRCR